MADRLTASQLREPRAVEVVNEVVFVFGRRSLIRWVSFAVAGTLDGSRNRHGQSLGDVVVRQSPDGERDDLALATSADVRGPPATK